MINLLSWMFGALNASVLDAALTQAGPKPHAFQNSLSCGAEVYHPGSEEFANASRRWSASQTPGFDAIIRVATEKDVQHTILYANAHNKPFLAISGGHGTSNTISTLKNGVGILLHNMNNITIIDNGTAALMEGGVQTGNIIAYLWSQGKQTMTTGCDCVGYMAPILGGGHGWLQGRYGKASDQLLSARLVLANGTAIHVSRNSNTDLFWAIRGAGHNFGIVTQVKVKIYDREPKQDLWAATSFVFTHDKTEVVFALVNTWLDEPSRPVELAHYGIFAHNPDVDKVNPVLVFWVYFQAPSIPTQYTDPLYALSPVAVDETLTDLTGVNAHNTANRDGAACAKGFSRTLLPVSAKRYSLPALRKILDIFAAFPTEYRSSVMFLEGFATNRVSAIESDDSAYPDRDGKLLISPLLTYAANASLDAGAKKIGDDIKSALLAESDEQPKAYVNYARGDESLEEVYGYEPWRLEKLRRLKNEFDPYGRFNFYAPIS